MSSEYMSAAATVTCGCLAHSPFERGGTFVRCAGIGGAGARLTVRNRSNLAGSPAQYTSTTSAFHVVLRGKYPAPANAEAPPVRSPRASAQSVSSATAANPWRRRYRLSCFSFAY